MDFSDATEAPVWLDVQAATVMRDGNRLLDDINLSIRHGVHTALLGPNGSGKSTLVKLVERRLYPVLGDAVGDVRPHVRLFGRERWVLAELRTLIGVVSDHVQGEFAADAGLTAYAAVVSGFFAARGLGLDHVVDAGQRQRAIESLERMGVGHLAQRVVGSLSTGEARRVLIARALVHQPRVLLLDEPCAGLDMASRQHFLADLRRLAQTGTTLVMVTHHVEEVVPEINRVVLMRGGRIHADGSKAEMLTADHLTDVFAMPVEVQARGAWYAARPR